MPKAVVTGASGLLGRQIIKALDAAGWDSIGTGFSRASPPKIVKVDIQNHEEINQLFSEVRPQVLVHCAANRQPDSCTNNPEAAKELNVIATENLARACSTHNTFLIYISTDYVFPGVQGEAPYKVSDQPRPTNHYGQTKWDGEKAVLETNKRAVVLRVPVLYGHTEPATNNKESAVNVLMDSLYKSQKESVKMDDWAIRYPTNTEDVGRVCADIAKLYVDSNEDMSRILQFSSEDRMTKYEITETFAEIMGLPMDGVVRDTEGGKPVEGVVRPYDCHLDTTELKRVGIDVRTVNFAAWWRRKYGCLLYSSGEIVDEVIDEAEREMKEAI